MLPFEISYIFQVRYPTLARFKCHVFCIFLRVDIFFGILITNSQNLGDNKYMDPTDTKGITLIVLFI